MPETRNIKLTLAYDGSAFCGWQVQPQLRTVQATLEDVLGGILGHAVPVQASGRTDTGVHALAQVANFRTGVPIPLPGLQKALDNALPSDIAVSRIEVVPPEFNARHSARAKTYAYVIRPAAFMSPLLARYVLHVREGLDICAMKNAAALLEGEHDFRAFMGAGSGVQTTVREIFTSELQQKDGQLIYVVRGSGFLRHMVRNIVGTLLLVGKGAMQPEAVTAVMADKDRSKAGPTAPSQGLYLVGVEY